MVTLVDPAGTVTFPPSTLGVAAVFAGADGAVGVGEEAAANETEFVMLDLFALKNIGDSKFSIFFPNT